jgi:hypothetical protein
MTLDGRRNVLHPPFATLRNTNNHLLVRKETRLVSPRIFIEWKHHFRADPRSGLVILLGNAISVTPRTPTMISQLPPFVFHGPLVQGSLGAFLMTGPETECFRAHTNADVRTRTEPRP